MFLNCWTMLSVDTFSKACFPALKLNWFKFPISMPLSLQMWSYHPSLLLQDRSLYHHYDIEDIWFGLQYQNVTFCRCVYTTFNQTETVSQRCFVFVITLKCKNSKTVLSFSMNVDRLMQRSHLSLTAQNSVHPYERELVITGLKGVFMEYCFREWLTPSCFVFARRETSEADRIDSGWEWAAVGGFIYCVSSTISRLMTTPPPHTRIVCISSYMTNLKCNVNEYIQKSVLMCNTNPSQKPIIPNPKTNPMPKMAL